MKKALALMLALVLALSMAVSSFALTLVLDVVEEDETDLIEFVDTFDYVEGNYDDELVIITSAYYGGDFYTVLQCAEGHDLEDEDLESIKITTSGNVTAELIDYDPETMVDYLGTDETNKIVTYAVKKYVGKSAYDSVEDDRAAWATGKDIENLNYETAVTLADALNKKYDTTEYRAVANNDVYVVKFSVDDNFSASYTEGTVKITATCDNCDESVAFTATVINDVHIFGYEAVKSAAEYYADGEYLSVEDKGYSDWETAVEGYGSDEIDYFYDGAVVISTTAFRAIAGENIVVDAGNNMVVTIKEVVSGQKGVNFLSYGDDDDTDEIEFGFLGNQVISSGFEIEVDLGMSYFDLREHFLEKIEEDDIVDFYLTKDGKVIDTIEVDFMTVDYDEDFVLVIEGENTTLGQYTIDIAAPVSADTDSAEENPNTGAESVVGVVAALAAVSVATAAAVSLKK